MSAPDARGGGVDALAIVQARMSSRRFPGKMLAPLAGRPVVDHVVERAARAVGRDRVVVVTSEDPSDDPLATHLRARDFAVVRGPLKDVAARFRLALKEHPAPWFLRICGDSPLLDADLLRHACNVAADRGDADLDIVSNCRLPDRPPGQAVELVRTDTFLGLDHAALTADQKEHVTRVFYDRPDDFSIFDIEWGHNADTAGADLCVDRVEDIARLEGMMEKRETVS